MRIRIQPLERMRIRIRPVENADFDPDPWGYLYYICVSNVFFLNHGRYNCSKTRYARPKKRIRPNLQKKNIYIFFHCYYYLNQKSYSSTILTLLWASNEHQLGELKKIFWKKVLNNKSKYCFNGNTNQVFLYFFFFFFFW